jgi:hypothetical protein
MAKSKVQLLKTPRFSVAASECTSAVPTNHGINDAFSTGSQNHQDGADLNPLLQDFGLIVHPPMLYMGYVGFSVAFAFAIAALLSGRMDAAWNSIKIKNPRSGSLANACTEVNTPERTRKVPNKLKEKAKMAKSKVQLLKTPRFSVDHYGWFAHFIRA